MQHTEQPQAISWLHKRGITSKVIDAFSISVRDVPELRLQNAIVIPVNHIDGTHAFNKYRRDPMEGNVKPKYLFERGGKVTLYGADKLLQSINSSIEPVIITEGELDTLVCWSQNIVAVSSTAGASSFQPEWVDLLKNYDVFVCFDNDEAGMKGALKVLDLLPRAHIIIVPNQLEVKDISDYVARGGTVADLLTTAFTVSGIEDATVQKDMLSAAWRLNEAKFFELYIEHEKEKTKLPSDTKGKASPTSTSDDRLERAKSVDCTTLLPFTRKGRYPVTECKWHNDHDPSLTYYARNNSCYCHVCGKYADAIDIVRMLHNCTLPQAIKILLDE